ncbi:hypothetical protein BGZ63DRAFT_403164 [Mariannaea sp. PMI_226]|nr:hypothetical protein BGZ63DRAFT_403164 [Mariannaea sp. PMI_226]
MERIDSHCHIIPPGCHKYCQESGFTHSDGIPEVPGSLAEIDYALDELGTVGFAVLTKAHKEILTSVERFSNFGFLFNQSHLNSIQVRQLFKARFYFDLAGFPFPDQTHGLL